MARLHKGSKPCGDVKLRGLSNVPDTCADIEDVIYSEIPTVNSVSDSDSLAMEYEIKGMPGIMTDLAGSEHHMFIQVLREDGSHLEHGEEVGPVNCLPQAMVSQADVYVNDVLVTKNNAMHHFRGFIETTYGHGPEAKTSRLENQLYHMDKFGDAFDQSGPMQTPVNAGFIARCEYIAESRVADMIWQPHVDLFTQNRAIPGNVDIRLRLTRSAPEFCLMAASGKKYKIKILKAVLYVRMIKPNKPVLTAIENLFEKNEKLMYPLHRVEMQTFVINSGIMSYSRPNLVTGRLPGRILIGLTTHKAFNGSYDRSPFRFSPHGINRINLVVNGRSNPTRPYTPNFIDKDNSGVQYARCYEAMARLAGSKFSSKGNMITRKGFGDGYTLFVFNLSEDWSDDAMGLVRDGIVQLDMGFAVPTGELLNGVVYMEFEDILSIDKDGVASLDEYV